MTSVLSLQGVTVLRRRAGFCGVSLEVAPGERVAIVGDHQPSLTLFVRACAGFEAVDEGAITLCGVDVRAADRDALLRLRRRVGYVSVSGSLLSTMTLRENLELALRYRAAPEGHGGVEMMERVSECIAVAGFEDLADEPASVAPAEVQKCFAYLRASLLEPDLVLVEDASAFLHPRGRTMVSSLHARTAPRGAAFVLADDDDAFVRPCVDRVVELQSVGFGELR